jgi:hypothetical protein
VVFSNPTTVDSFISTHILRGINPLWLTLFRTPVFAYFPRSDVFRLRGFSAASLERNY